jgi:hypothetical protein
MRDPLGSTTRTHTTMTPSDFRQLALRLPEAVQGAHMGHADFRIDGRIFATLGYPAAGWSMVKLSPEQQELFVRAEPLAFVPVKGAWGRQGCTNVKLRLAKKGAVREALDLAWQAARAKVANKHRTPRTPKPRSGRAA